MAISAPFIESA